jgi:hypothetical protein
MRFLKWRGNCCTSYKVAGEEGEQII